MAGHTAVEGAQGKGFVQGGIEGVVGSFAGLALVLVFPDPGSALPLQPEDAKKREPNISV